MENMGDPRPNVLPELAEGKDQASLTMQDFIPDEFPDPEDGLEDYYAYLEQVQAAEEEAIRRGSRTMEYLTFRETVRTTEYTVRFMSGPYAAKRQALLNLQEDSRRDASAAQDVSDAIRLDHVAQSAGTGLSLLDYAYTFVAQAQRQVYAAHLVNTLENYLIDITKRILLAYPDALKGNMPHEISTNLTYAEIQGFLGQPAEVQNLVLNRLILAEDRDYKLRSVLKILKGLRYKISMPMEEGLAMYRAIAIRNKLTHRAGKVDTQFIQELSPPMNGTEPYQVQHYLKIGAAAVNVGETYLVDADEMTEMIELVSNVALIVESVIVEHYPNLIAADGWDVQFSEQALEEALEVLSS